MSPTIYMYCVCNTFITNVMKWERFPRYGSFVREYNRHWRTPLTKGQYVEILQFSMMPVGRSWWTNMEVTSYWRHSNFLFLLHYVMGLWCPKDILEITHAISVNSLIFQRKRTSTPYHPWLVLFKMLRCLVWLIDILVNGSRSSLVPWSWSATFILLCANFRNDWTNVE